MRLHTKVQVVITSQHLAMALMFYVSRRWSIYLNRCVTASSLEDIGSPEETVLFYVEPLLLKL